MNNLKLKFIIISKKLLRKAQHLQSSKKTVILKELNQVLMAWKLLAHNNKIKKKIQTIRLALMRVKDL